MDNQKEKLLKLLQTAVQYGWNGEYHSDLIRSIPDHLDSYGRKYEFIFNSIYKGSVGYCNKIFDETYSEGFFESDMQYTSIDFLITYWEPEETSFIDALYKATIDWCIKQNRIFISTLNQEYVGKAWVSLPNSQRLNKLFELFNHLLE